MTKDEAAAASISRSSRTRLSSDEFLLPKDIITQLRALTGYVAHQRETAPEYDLPKPVGWRMLILVLQPPTETEGSLILPDDVADQYAHKSMQGIVLSMASGAYKDPDRFVDEWCKEGDRVVFKRYDAQPFSLASGQTLAFLSDTQVIGVLDGGWNEKLKVEMTNGE